MSGWGSKPGLQVEGPSAPSGASDPGSDRPSGGARWKHTLYLCINPAAGIRAFATWSKRKLRRKKKRTITPEAAAAAAALYGAAFASQSPSGEVRLMGGRGGGGGGEREVWGKVW